MAKPIGAKVKNDTGCGLSPQALQALWSVFGPASKGLQMTPADIPIVAEIQQWIQAEGAKLPKPEQEG